MNCLPQNNLTSVKTRHLHEFSKSIKRDNVLLPITTKSGKPSVGRVPRWRTVVPAGQWTMKSFSFTGQGRLVHRHRPNPAFNSSVQFLDN